MFAFRASLRHASRFGVFLSEGVWQHEHFGFTHSEEGKPRREEGLASVADYFSPSAS
jgi:hypothetical protein